MARVSTGQIVVVSSVLVVGLVAFAIARGGGGGGEPLDESEWAAQVCTVQSRLDDDLEAEIFGSPTPGLHLQLIGEAYQRAAEDLARISPPPSARVYHEAFQKGSEEVAHAAFAAMAALSDWTSEEEFEASLDALNAVSERTAEEVDAARESLPHSAKAALNGCMGR